MSHVRATYLPTFNKICPTYSATVGGDNSLNPSPNKCTCCRKYRTGPAGRRARKEINSHFEVRLCESKSPPNNTLPVRLQLPQRRDPVLAAANQKARAQREQLHPSKRGSAGAKGFIFPCAKQQSPPPRVKKSKEREIRTEQREKKATRG
jgi:hypothetical protein